MQADQARRPGTRRPQRTRVPACTCSALTLNVLARAPLLASKCSRLGRLFARHCRHRRPGRHLVGPPAGFQNLARHVLRTEGRGGGGVEGRKGDDRASRTNDDTRASSTSLGMFCAWGRGWRGEGDPLIDHRAAGLDYIITRVTREFSDSLSLYLFLLFFFFFGEARLLWARSPS